MRVRMLRTKRGASNGFTVRRYDQGECYELSDSLALNFISQGAAKAVTIGSADALAKKTPAKKTPAKKTKVKRKAIARAPENKGAALRA